MTINFYKLDVVPLSINLHTNLFYLAYRGILSATDHTGKNGLLISEIDIAMLLVRLDRRLAASFLERTQQFCYRLDTQSRFLPNRNVCLLV